MKSEIIRSVFLDEHEKNRRMVARYEKECNLLPKGSIFKRKIGKQEYLYLNYREGPKVISKFLGKADGYDISELQQQLARRKELMTLVKKLKIEIKEQQTAFWQTIKTFDEINLLPYVMIIGS